MDDELKAFIDTRFHIPPLEGIDKTCSLQEAVAGHVRGGMLIHIESGSGALLYQLVRQFWGKKADITLITTYFSDIMLALLCGGLLKKVITSYAGDLHPASNSQPLIQRAYISGAVEFENWTALTLAQRLMAGAMGRDFIPTGSIGGSSMAEENRESFAQMESPFASGLKTSVVRSLRPDIALVHGVAADRSGNTILTYPLGAEVYGALAAKEGVIVSVDHIVPSEYIRSQSHLVQIPAHLVRSVCEVPFGAHPHGLSGCGLPQLEGYFDDYDFIKMFNEASHNESRLMIFIQDWILGCADHQQYIEKLGKERLRHIKDKAKPHFWMVGTMAGMAQNDLNRESNQLERMVAAGSRYLADLCQKKSYNVLVSGMGLSTLSAWLAAYKLRDNKCDIELLSEPGIFGHLPRPSDPGAFNMHNFATGKMLTDINTALGVLASGDGGKTLGVFTAVQVDKHGNANLTKIPGVFYLVGSGSANDIASACTESVVFATASRENLVEEVPYITCPGDKIKTLITDVGIFQKLDGEETFKLTAYIPYATALREEEAIKGIRRVVGWQMDVAPMVKKLDFPAYEERTLIRLFDPEGYLTRP